MVSDWRDRVASDPHILRGKPCIKGTRIPVALVLGYLAAGREIDDVLTQFPDLTREDIQAAIGYARDLSDYEAA